MCQFVLFPLSYLVQIIMFYVCFLCLDQVAFIYFFYNVLVIEENGFLLWNGA